MEVFKVVEKIVQDRNDLVTVVSNWSQEGDLQFVQSVETYKELEEVY